ncbi:MAG: LysR family transcriptional regulator ArgP [Desulfobacteraceae bacterium]|nr:LysR family transcriptional regulator ArgP [Desulfobacteraceae bacterium]
MFDYKLIQAYAMVIQESGFERASGKIHITQSAISQRVKQLEDQVGQILLLRTVPPVPTPAGKKILKLYHQVKHLEDDLNVSFEPEDKNVFTPVPIAVNADTLDTWFFDAIQPFLDQKKVILDLFVDDQERTHHFLRDGKVLACISTRDTAIQGCRVEQIGDMEYGLYCSKVFAKKWFPNGLNLNRLKDAPGICFSRDDNLNTQLFEQLFKTQSQKMAKGMPMHYVPSSVMFINLLKNGIAYGVLPRQQSQPLINKKQIVDLAPDTRVRVCLYWHCWNLNSKLLQTFTAELLKGFNRVNNNLS